MNVKKNWKNVRKNYKIANERYNKIVDISEKICRNTNLDYKELANRVYIRIVNKSSEIHDENINGFLYVTCKSEKSLMFNDKNSMENNVSFSNNSNEDFLNNFSYGNYTEKDLSKKIIFFVKNNFNYKEVIIFLRMLKGYKYNEISKQLNINIEMIKGKIFKIRKHINRFIKNNQYIRKKKSNSLKESLLNDNSDFK